MKNYKMLSPEEKRKFWQQHIDGWRKSGQSQAEYCRKHKITKSALGYWRTRLSREAGLVEVQAKPPAPEENGQKSSIDIIIRDTIKLQVRRGFDTQLLIRTIKTLEELS